MNFIKKKNFLLIFFILIFSKNLIQNGFCQTAEFYNDDGNFYKSENFSDENSSIKNQTQNEKKSLNENHQNSISQNKNLNQDNTKKNLAKKFEYKYNENDSYRILSTVEEDIYVNGYESHTAEIINRISVKVTNVTEDKKRALHTGTFMTTENAKSATNPSQKIFTYGQDYNSVFTRDNLGVYVISDKYFMPTVRDVPVFLDREITPGTKWTHQGHEVHDLRNTFGIQKPYKVPFVAEYEYIGEKVINGKTLDLFQVQYKMNFSADKSWIKRALSTKKNVPIKTEGFSSQLIYWDNEKGAIDNYGESFRIDITTLSGDVFSFAGNANAELTDFERVATENKVEELSQKIEDLGLENVQAKITEKGLTLSIENIQFLPDSNILLVSEKEKLNKIASILAEYKNNDLLISGHTALRGTKAEREKLSQERADAVAEFLISIGVKDRYHIFTKALGASEPIATNDTEEGRKKNRRVEITIMD